MLLNKLQIDVEWI